MSDKYSQQGNTALLGRDPLERASIEQWLRSEEHSFDPSSWTLFFHLAVAPYVDPAEEEDRSDLIQECERKLSDVLDVYNQRLGESKYLAGNDFSMADLSHLPNSHYLANSKEWSYLFSSRKHVRKWWKKISERNSWVKTVKIIDQLPVLAGKPSLCSTKTLIPPLPRPSQITTKSASPVPKQEAGEDLEKKDQKTAQQTSSADVGTPKVLSGEETPAVKGTDTFVSWQRSIKSVPSIPKQEAGGDSKKKDQKNAPPAATADVGTTKVLSGEETPVIKGTDTFVPWKRSIKSVPSTPKQEAGGDSEKKDQKTAEPEATADTTKAPTGGEKTVKKGTTESVPPAQKLEVEGDLEKKNQTLKPAISAGAARAAKVPTGDEKSVEKAREIDPSPPSPDPSSLSNGGKLPEPPSGISS